eukprot:TRINITY_DN12955_c1_g1_i1.p1 TRINITY_DN12955_c1_g1~~TRINITY_DN12955_c1_g1_i1.p1  ORF type:complete len:357 (-),score=27.00 TRINITY_DN12955_c1_g1_i1:16-1086(-)
MLPEEDLLNHRTFAESFPLFSAFAELVTDALQASLDVLKCIDINSTDGSVNSVDSQLSPVKTAADFAFRSPWVFCGLIQCVDHAFHPLGVASSVSPEFFPMSVYTSASILQPSYSTPWLSHILCCEAPQVCHLVAGVAMVLGGWSCLRRFNALQVHQLRDTSYQSRAVVMLCLTGCGHVMACLSYHSKALLSELVLRDTWDILAQPVLISNLAYVCGANHIRSPIWLTIIYEASLVVLSTGLLSTTGCMVLCSAPVILNVVLIDAIRQIKKGAWLVSSTNSMRASLAGDLLVFCVSVNTCIHVCVAAHAISHQAASAMLSLLDVACKLGVSHLMLRSPRALSIASELEKDLLRNIE